MRFCRLTAIATIFAVFAATALAGVPEVKISGGRLSVHAENATVSEVLQCFVDQGVNVMADPEIDARITASFSGKRIQAGLASVFKSLNHVIVWEKIEIEPGRPFYKLAEIQVFGSGGKDSVRPLQGSAPFALEKDKNGSLYVKNEILLRLKPGMDQSEFKEFGNLLAEIGGNVTDAFRELGIYRIRVPDGSDLSAIVERFGKHPAVSKAEPNYAYPIIPPYAVSNSKAAPEIPGAVRPDGSVPVAIFDTGLAPDSGLNDSVVASLDALNPDNPISDTQGHGTQMAHIASGSVQPVGGASNSGNAPVIPIRAFDDNGVTSSFTIMESIDFAIKNGARVLSLSWGTETESEFLKNAFDYADAKGLITVAAAGNEPTGRPVYPAAFDSVIGVGALGPDGKPWEKSNYGSFVSLYAPGFATLPVGYMGEPGPYAGTSISTAYTAKTIAGYLSENPGATKEQVFKGLE